jgi:hypothetical protein
LGEGILYSLLGAGCIWVGNFLGDGLGLNAFVLENVGLLVLILYIALKEFSWKKGRPQMIEK